MLIGVETAIPPDPTQLAEIKAAIILSYCILEHLVCSHNIWKRQHSLLPVNNTNLWGDNIQEPACQGKCVLVKLRETLAFRAQDPMA